MSDKYDCNIVANNGTDFIIADRINNGKVPILIGGASVFESTMDFNINDLCQKKTIFNIRLQKALRNIDKLDKNDGYIHQSLSHIQQFIEKEMPLCKPEMTDERMGCLFDNEPFNHFVEHKLCMCCEQAAMAQYMCQQAGIKSYFVNSYADIENVTTQPDLHAYVMYEDKGNMFVYDPANPRSGDRPRVLNANMNKAIFKDFVDAVKHNKDSNDNKSKNRVGFRCVDEENNQSFVYQSKCGIAGNTLTPSKLKAKADEAYLETTKYGNSAVVRK